MAEKDHLTILWTNGDPVTAEKMVFMYGINSLLKGWWARVTLVIWGTPAKLSAENPDIQEKIKKALDTGVHVTACKACADQLGVTETLEKMNVEVKYWGEPLTDILKSEGPLLTI
ncbi:MAG: DsrE family protein [Deltaproteobacteria bacterium]|nr:DsrE family protein [Deltaproteobacteria bacterium]